MAKKARPRRARVAAPDAEDEAGASSGRCPSCGARAPLSWHGRRKHLCAPCVQATLHPIEREPATVGALVRGTLRLARADALLLCAAVVLPQLPLVALLLTVQELPPIVSSLWGLATILGTGAATELALSRVDAQRPSLASAYGVALRRWLGIIAANLFAGLIILLFAVLLVVPGVLRALSYAIVLPLIVDGEAHGVDALELSRRRMRGHRLPALGVFALAFLPGLLSFAVYLLSAQALTGADPGELVFSSPQVQDPETLALLDAADALLYPIFDLPVVLAAVALHVKLRRAR